MGAIGIGEIAGLTTAVSWAGSCQIHTMAGRIIGAVNVTTARTPLYVAATGLVALFSGASPGLPAEALPYLVLSSIAGISVCDPLLYSASLVIGPRLAVLIQSLSACLTAILGYIFLGESINLVGWLGIVTASFGVAFVLLEGGIAPAPGHGVISRIQFWKGVGMAFLAAMSLAFSFLCLKQALSFGVHPLWAAFIRMCVGGGTLWLFMLLRGKLFSVMRSAWTSWPVMRLLLAGCCVATIGNCLSAVAMKYTQAGIAATLIGLQPIMMIAITTALDRKMPTPRAILGTVIAFSGTAMIFLRPA